MARGRRLHAGSTTSAATVVASKSKREKNAPHTPAGALSHRARSAGDVIATLHVYLLHFGDGEVCGAPRTLTCKVHEASYTLWQSHSV